MSRFECIFFGNELPKGDLRHIFRRLHLHSKHARHPLLARFMHQSTQAIRHEVSRLPSEIKAHVPPFDGILDWGESDHLRQGLLCGAVEGVLLVVAQIGAYIGHVEASDAAFPSPASLHNAGLGVGLLAATVATLSATPSDLPLIGADIVRIAFRLGVHVYRVSDDLEAPDSSSPAPADTWAYVVQDLNPEAAQAELDSLHARENVPATAKLFISAVSPTSVTVSGPPVRLRALFHKSPLFRDAKSLPLPVYGGLCHAPHIYQDSDVQAVLDVEDEPFYAIASRKKPVATLYSTGNGKPYSANDAHGLYSLVLAELMTRAIHWQLVVDGLAEKCKDFSGANLYSFGNTLPLNDLKKTWQREMPALELSVENLCVWYDAPTRDSTPRGTTQDKLAIVGMSCRLPGGATSLEKFWDVLEQGLDVSRKIPADRFDIETHYDSTGTQMNKSMTQYGCFIDEPGLFDAPFFNMSPREAQVTDPQMRLALVTAYEALEQAGYVGGRTFSTRAERIGTYYGQAADDYREVNQGQEVSTYYIPGGCRAFGPGRINYFFKFAGPSYSIDTACSSGLAAIEVACQALWAGDVDTAVTGGLNVLTNPDGFSGLCNGHFLTKGHNACKTWDTGADGYCRADGVGSLVIKRLSDAKADNDNILGVILGAGTNHSATAVSITHPHAGHQAYLSRQVLARAGVDPLDVSYVELHGTGTQAGDSHEMAGIVNTYAPLVNGRNKKQPLHIGAVKANMGHSESAAGTTALLKVLLMLQKNAIPRHIGIKTEINPALNAEEFPRRNVHIPFAATEWPRPQGKQRTAVVNSFGAAGGNTTMVLQDAPARSAVVPDPRPTHIVLASAKTKTSLAGNLQRLIDYLDSHSSQGVNLADLSYSTTARRYQHVHRIAVATNDVAELRKRLTSQLEAVESVKPVPKSAPSIAFAFTGQGAAHKSSNLALYRDSSFFRDQIERLDAIAQRQGFQSFKHVLDGSYPQDYPDHSPVVTQLAQVCSQIALVKYWASLGVKPDVVMGHSLGEYAAMYAAGVVTANEAVYMVGYRASMLQERCKSGSHTMVAVRSSLDVIQANSAGKPYTVACINGPSDTVLSGTKEQMDDIANTLQTAGLRCITLDVAFAFHSEQTDPILDDLEAVTKSGIVFQEPRLPVISPLLGKVVFDGKTFNSNYIRRSTRETVNFLTALENAKQIGSVDDETIWVEIGPHPVCAGFVKSAMPSARTVASMRRGEDNWKTVAESMASLHLAGISVDWNEFHRPFESNLRLLGDLPTYAFNEKTHWLQYKGDWCLTKGNTFYESDAGKPQASRTPAAVHDIQTSIVHQVVDENFQGTSALLSIQSDLMQPDFLSAANGHRMNSCGVVTSSIHADIAYTLGTYMYRKLYPKTKSIGLEVANLVVTQGLVARNGKFKQPQEIRVTATTDDLMSGVDLKWQIVDAQGNVPNDETFATADIYYGDLSAWMASWRPLSHLVHGRIEELDRLATAGEANRFSRKMAYGIFAANLVDYADKYRGMQSVVMHGLEAYANVKLPAKENVTGHWTVPPYFIDSVAHLAGFIMNCSDAMDTQNKFCTTPGWASMRFAEPLTPGAEYRSYVKMVPTKEDHSIYFGDVYVMRAGDFEIIGLVQGIKFCAYPRILLDRFFSSPDKASSTNHEKVAAPVAAAKPALRRKDTPAVAEFARSASEEDTRLPLNKPDAVPGPPKKTTVASTTSTSDSQPMNTPASSEADTISSKALQLIANEAALDIAVLTDEVSFSDLGVDSLMSLVIAEKLKAELGVQVGGTLFLDYPTIGEMRGWLDEAYA